jgi:hypothetical protein
VRTLLSGFLSHGPRAAFGSVFKYMCTARLQKMERKSIDLACLSWVAREGGWKVALISRYSTIPGHCELSHFVSLRRFF